MKGLVANPSGRTIELPIQSNLKDGFSVLEFFIATHGGRKGKSDTALKTAEAGYLTRRLVDAVQDIVIREDDCGSKDFHSITRLDSEKIGEKFEIRIFGRRLAADLEAGGETIAKRNDEIDAEIMKRINEHKVESIPLRSVMTCKTLRGICKKCYGRDLGDNKTVEIGTPVGIIAAQSIGEPGTQLTMRTFHMGGVAEGGDITQGLNRVEELSEARTPRTPAILSDIAGRVKVSHAGGRTVIHVVAQERGEDRYLIPAGFKIAVKKGQEVRERTVIAKASTDKSTVKALIAGTVTTTEGGEVGIRHEQIQERNYEFTSRETVLIKNGDMVEAGQALNAGHYNLHELLEKKARTPCRSTSSRRSSTSTPRRGRPSTTNISRSSSARCLAKSASLMPAIRRCFRARPPTSAKCSIKMMPSRNPREPRPTSRCSWVSPAPRSLPTVGSPELPSKRRSACWWRPLPRAESTRFRDSRKTSSLDALFPRARCTASVLSPKRLPKPPKPPKRMPHNC